MNWLQDHQTLLWALGTFSVITFVGSLIVIPVLIMRMQADYFLSTKDTTATWAYQHPAVTLTIKVLKNVLGVLFILAGIAMLVLPGQGVLTILIGISCMNFPGKQKLELTVVRLPAVLKSINWIRAKGGRAPLELPQA